jgi:Na+-transporting methylmalonyl-CoA/oxaloacetate decarboxylase gamma subunit
MDNVMNAMRGISDAVNKAHAHLFPNHWKDPDQKPKKTSKNKETEEKSNTKKKPAAKAKSKKKD